MKTISPIYNYKQFSFEASITPKHPASGFSLAFGYTGYTGVSGAFVTGVVFSGRDGLIFDQSGRFFGGYYSGRPLDIEGHFFGGRLSYFYNGSLVNNNVVFENDFNAIEFDKIGDSEMNLALNYASGKINENSLRDSNRILLLSADNYYILPTL